MINVNQITSYLSKLQPDSALQRYAMMHKDDPYIVSLALAESNRRKDMRMGAQIKNPQQPKVADQAIQGMASVDPMGNYVGTPMPETVGIGQLPAKNIAKMAGGGIVAFADGGETDDDYMYPPGEVVARMAGGGSVPRFNGATGSFMGPVMSFQQFLQSQGLTTAEFANASPRDQQILRDAFKSSGMGAPSAGAAPAQAAAPSQAAPAQTTPTEPGRAYNLAKSVGKFARASAPAAVGLETLGNLGSYKFQEPELDTSVSGVAKALGKGEYGQAVKNLAMGLPEAGLDVLRGGASIGDYLLPGQPLSTGMDQGLKTLFGDKIRTPSDAVEAVKAAQASALSPNNQSDAETQRLVRQNASVEKPLPDGKPAPTQADQLADLRRQYQSLVGPSSGAAMPSTAGLPGLKPPTAEEARTMGANLVGKLEDSPAMKRFEQMRLQVEADLGNRAQTFLEEQAALPKFGVKAEEQLQKREKELADDKKAAGWMAVIETGLGIMASTSPFALANIGAGGQRGLASYRDAMKDFKKLQSEYDKMRLDIERAQIAEKREDFKARNEFFDRIETRRDNINKMGIDIVQTHTGLNAKVSADVWAAGMQQYGETARTVYREQGAALRSADDNRSRVALGLMGLMQEPSELRTLRGIAGDPKLEALYGRTNRQDAALLQEYIKNPTKLKLLEQTDPAAAAIIRQKIMSIGAQPVNVDKALP